MLISHMLHAYYHLIKLTVVSYHSPSEHVNQSTNQELFQIQKVTNKNARPIQISVSANRSNHAKQRYEDMK